MNETGGRTSSSLEKKGGRGLALVLSGGGARAAYQVGALKCIGERRPDFFFPIMTGVSSGAINAIFLASHTASPWEAANELAGLWRSMTVDQTFRASLPSLTSSALHWAAAVGTAGSVLVPELRGLVDTTPLRNFLRKHLDFAGVEANIQSGRLKAAAVSALHYSTGETITFVQSREGISPWLRAMRRGVLERITLNHVMASASIPLVFPPVQVGDHFYGDGAVRQTAPLAPAIHIGAQRILAIAVRYPKSPQDTLKESVRQFPSPARILGLMFHAIFADSLDADEERLHRTNRLLERWPVGVEVPDHLRPIRLKVIRPSDDVGAMAAGSEAAMPLGLRMLARGLGTHKGHSSADFLSYMMFTPDYIDRLMALGYQDVDRQWNELAHFFDEEEP